MITIIYTTFPDKKSASDIAKELLKEKLVVCCNIFPILSLYHWKEELQEDQEYAALFKTSLTKTEAAIDKINTLHPYDIPLITRDTKAINKAYEIWMQNELSDEDYQVY